MVSAYIASYLVTACGVSAVTSTVGEPGFTRAIFFLLTCGYLASFAAQMEHLWWGRILRITATMVGLGSVPVLALFISPASIFPLEALADQDLRAAVLLAWLAVILSFLLGSLVLNQRVALSFPIVPTVSMFGLIGRMNPNTNITLAFVAFVCFAIFLVSYENTMGKSPSVVLGFCRADVVKRLTYQHFLIAAAFTLPVMLCAVLLSGVLRKVVPPWFSRGLQQMHASMAEIIPTSWTRFADTFTLTGGPMSLGNTTRMLIEAPDGFRWRGQVYNQFDGHTWRQVDMETRIKPSIVRPDGTLVFVNSVKPIFHEVLTRVKLVSSMPGILYSPGIPLSVQSSKPGVELTEGDCLRTSRLVKGDRYTVKSAVLMPEEHLDELRKSYGSFPDTLWEKYYLALPRGSLRVKKLAEDLVSREGVTTPYGKALLFADYLRRRCRYSLNPPLVPSQADAAEFFIFQSRRGACDMFATALAVMCRAVDVPSRVVTGYAPGKQVEGSSEGNMKRFAVRDRDAHAWVEIYVNEKWGWVPIDPTEGVRESNESWWRQLASGHRWEGWIRFTHQNFLPLCATMLLVWSALQLARRPTRSVKLHQPRRVCRLTGYRAQMCGIYLRMCRLLLRGGVPWNPAMAPAELLHLISVHTGEGDGSVVTSMTRRIAERFARACYSNRAFSQSEVKAARRELAILKACLRREVSRRFRSGRRRVGEE